MPRIESPALLSVLIFFSSLMSQTPGQDLQDVGELSQALEKFENARSKLNSFVARLTILRFGTNEIPGLKWKYTRQDVYELVADRTSDCMLVCTNSKSFANPVSTSGASGLFLKKRGEWFSRSGKSLERHENWLKEFPNPLTIGAGGPAETSYYQSLEQQVATLKMWEVRPWTSQQTHAGEIVVKSHSDSSFTFAPKQDFGITQLLWTHGRCKCRYKQVHGFWLPERAFYEQSSGKAHFVLIEWIAINPTLPVGIFDPGSYAGLAGLDWDHQDTIRKDASNAIDYSERIAKLDYATTPAQHIFLSPKPNYRDLLLPLVYDRRSLGKKLGISDEQYVELEKLREKGLFEYPDFPHLDSSDAEIRDFVADLQARSNDADQVFANAWEILNQQQKDALLAISFDRFGLAGLNHPAAMDRLEITEVQQKELNELSSKRTQVVRGIWEAPIISNGRLRHLSTLATQRSTLALASLILDTRQQQGLDKILEHPSDPRSTAFFLGL